MNSNLPYIAKIEWESLQHKQERILRKKSDFLPSIFSKLELDRDENYSIRAKFIGRVNNLKELNEWLQLWNKADSIGFITPLDFDFSDNQETYKMIGCDLENIKHTNIYCDNINDQNLIDSNLDFEAEFEVKKIYKEYPEFKVSDQEGWLTEWYLNGSNDIPFTRCTTRLITEYRRKRDNLNDFSFKFPELIFPDFDYVFIQTGDISFIVHSVPEDFTPSWSRGLGIEYRGEWGKIPEPQEREAISEIVGFIIGRQLLHVGYTRFNEIGYAVEESNLTPIRPLKMNLRNSCQMSSDFPVRIGKGESGEKLETVLQALIHKYLTLRNDLKLDKALQSYWLFKEIPIGKNIPILAASIEILADNYLDYKNISKSGEYMSKNNFKQLLKDEIKSIEQKLKNEPQGGKILEKIKSVYSYQLGVSAKSKRFFKEIGLTVNDKEEQAMKARNDMVHGTLDFSNEEERRNMYTLTKVYETLFNRIILKILGFEGTYIDYSVFGLPERHIDEPTGS